MTLNNILFQEEIRNRILERIDLLKDITTYGINLCV